MSDKQISGWEKWAAIGVVVQAVVVVITLGLIKSQLSLQTEQLKLQTKEIKRQTDLAAAANFQSLAAVAIPMNLAEVEHAEIERLWLSGAQGFNVKTPIATNEVKQEQYRALLSSWMIFYENMFYQHSHRLLADEVYSAWDRDLKSFVIRFRLKDYWPDMRDSYHKKFREHIDQLIKSGQP